MDRLAVKRRAQVEIGEQRRQPAHAVEELNDARLIALGRDGVEALGGGDHLIDMGSDPLGCRRQYS